MNFDAPSAMGKSKTASNNFKQWSCTVLPSLEVDVNVLSKCLEVVPVLTSLLLNSRADKQRCCE